MFFKREKKQTKRIEPVAEVKRNGSIYDVELDADEKPLADMVKEYAVTKSAPKPSYPEGTAMDSCESSPTMEPSAGFVNPRSMRFYIASSSFMGYYNMAIIAQHWFVMKGCSWKAREAVKKWFEVSDNGGEALTPTQSKFIEKCNQAYKLRENLLQAVTFNNIFGVRHILFKHKDPNFDYSTPFNPDAFANGNYAGMSQIDPYWMNPALENDDLTDPTRINFYEPEYWTINGKLYHRSHFVILKGEEVSDYLKPTYRYGGISLVQRLYERVYASESTANEAPELTKSKRLYVRKVNIDTTQAGVGKFRKAMNFISRMRDNFGTEIMGKEDEMMKFDTALTDLDQVIMTQFHLACAIIGGPVSKILGTGHSGFSTGETDDDFWIQGVEELQGNEMKEIVEAHFARLIPSEITPKLNITPEIDITWNSLKVMSEKEEAEVRQFNANTVSILYGEGLITKDDTAKFLAKDKGFDISASDKPVEHSDIEEDDIYTDEFERDDIQQQSLNGAQVQSLVDVASKVKIGELERDAAIEIITSSFPIDREQAKLIIPETSSVEKESI